MIATDTLDANIDPGSKRGSEQISNTEEVSCGTVAEQTIANSCNSFDSQLNDNQAVDIQESASHPVAIVCGQAMQNLPTDLYIPPDALEVILETFTGPLDVLLYLIKRQNLDILDIPIAEITRQYMHYVELMREFRLELAAEYLLMAALLAEIKSRMLLPKPATEEESEEDPRAELVRRLQEYERYKQAADELDELPRRNREVFWLRAKLPASAPQRPMPEVQLGDLLRAYKGVMLRVDQHAHHQVHREVLSIRERMTQVLAKLQQNSYCQMPQLLKISEGRMGVVVTFIAILELAKQSIIEIAQTNPYSPIHLKSIN